MRKSTFKSAVLVLAAAFCLISCAPEKEKVWGWVSGNLSMPDDKLEHYFSKCKEVGIDAIIMECHSGKPVVLDSTTFRDSAALEIIKEIWK